MAEKIFNIGEVRTVSHCQHPLGRNLLSLKLQNHHKNCYHCHYYCRTIIRTVIIFSQSEGFPPVATGGNPGCHQNVHWHRWHEPYEWSVMVISKTTHQNAHYHHHWHRSHVITHQPYERSERASPDFHRRSVSPCIGGKPSWQWFIIIMKSIVFMRMVMMTVI